jgi:hypothetical protein
MRKLKIFEHISLDGVIEIRGAGENSDRKISQLAGRVARQAQIPRESPRKRKAL